MTKSMMVRGMAAVCALAVFSCLPALAQSAAARRVTQKIDETKLTTLTGHIHPAANALNDRGPVEDSAPVGHIVLMLKRSDDQQRSLDAAIDQLHNPNSESFHKWLTPEEFGRRFGPADEDVAAVAGWLQSKGFTIEDMPPSKTHITFTGTVGEMRQAFHVNIHHLSVNGEAHEATMNEPRIPSALAPVVSGFRQLHDFWPKPMLYASSASKIDIQTGKPVQPSEDSASVHADFNTTSTTTPYEVGPQDFYTIYNENSLLNSGITGAGVTVAVIERTEITNSDVTNFRSLFGLAAYPATPNATQGGVSYIYGSASGVGGDTACTAPETGGPSADEGNADIGVEWAGVVAPKAIIDFVACGAASTTIGSDGTDLAASHIANYLSSTVVAASLAYGECEISAGTTGQTYYTGLWEQYAAEGITAVVSAGETGNGGDPGSLGCDAQSTSGTHNPSVNAKAATAYNLSAGGTDFGDMYISKNYSTEPASTWWSSTNGTGESSALSYVPEIAWGGECSSALRVSYLQAEGTTTYGSTYTPEAICNNANATSLLTVAGGGGGVSIYNTIPSWQSVYGIGLYSSSTTYRNQPDVSLFAASGAWGHMLPYCQADNGTAGKCTSATTTAGAGGTSFVSPSVAGLMALVAQKTGDRQGQAAYTLYALAQKEYGTPGSPNTANLASCSGSAKGASVGSTCVFYDIAADTPSLQGGTIASDTIQPCTFGGANDTDCYRSSSKDTYGLSSTGNDSATLAYQAGAGYDLTTGLGSFNIANLVNAWSGSSSSPSFSTTTALTAVSGTTTLTSPASVVYSTTANLTFTATVTATGRGGEAPAGTVEFFDGGSTSGTLLGSAAISSNCTGTGTSTKCVGVATLSLATSTLVFGSSNNVVAYFEGDAANDAASTSSVFTINVSQATQAITFNSANTGTYGGTLTLSATASSGLTPVTFAISGGTGAAALNNDVLTFTGPGTIIITASQAGNSFYASTSATQTITVGKAALTVNVANASMTYGGGFPAFGDSSITGLVNGDTVGTTITVTYSSTTAATSNAGTYAGAITATVGGSHSGDYTVTVNSGTLTINAAVLTVNVANESMNYGAAFPTFTGTVTGLENGDTVGTKITVTYSSTTAATSNAGTYAGAITATVGGTSVGNYTVTVNKGTLTINAAALTVNVANESMNYGAAFPTFTGTVTGLENGDTVGTKITVTYSSTTAATSNAGTYAGAITATVGGTSAGNYTVTVNKGTLTITAVALTINVANATMNYGAGFPTFTDTSITGLKNGDTVGGTIIVTYSSTTPASSNVGTYAGAITATVSGTSAGNYTVTVNTGTLTIKKVALSVTVNAASMTYGSGFPTFSSTLATLVNGDTVGGTIILTYSSTTAANSNVGTYRNAISVAVSGTSAGNYTVTTTKATLTITQAALAVDVNAASMTYGGSFPTFSGTLVTLVNGDTLGGTITVTYSSTTAATSNAGTYAGAITATVGGTSAGNYTVTVNAGTLTINAAALTVNVASASMTYGAGFPTFTDTSITGLVNGDTVGTKITVTYSSTTPANSNAGIYAGAITATVGGTHATNYTVTVNAGTLTINKAALTITVNAASMTYGGGFPTFSGTLATLVNGDAVGGTITVTYSSTTGASSNVGTYAGAITATLGGTSAGNYTLTVKTATLTIAKAALTITVNPASMTYGGGFPTFTSTLATLVNGDTVGGTITLTYSSTTPATSNIGTYSNAISVTAGGTSVGNYTVTTTKATLTITKAALTVTVNPASMTYGGSFPTFSGTLATLVNGDTLGGTITVSYSSTTPANSNAGSYAGAITATVGGTSAGNYTVTVNAGTLTINKAGLTVNVNPASMTYGGSFPTFTDSSITGLVNGDTVGGTITVSYSSTTPANSNAGTYAGAITATVGGTHATNYTVTVNAGTLTINKAALTITVNAASMTYGGGFPTFTSSLATLVNGDTVGGTITVSYSSTTPANSNVGTYAGAVTATLGGTSSGNYTVTVNKGTLTINKAGLTVNVNAASMTYGSGFPAFTGNLVTLVNGDTVGTTISVTYSSTTPANSSAGSYAGAITASVGGSSSGNYTVTVNKGTLTINKAALTVTVNPASITYGGSFPTFSGTLATLVNGDTLGGTITVTYSSTTPANSNAGSYAGAITATVSGTSSGNYTVTVNAGTLTINKTGLTISENPVSGVYGVAPPAFTGSVTGNVNGDTVGTTLTVTYSSTASSSSPFSDVGSYPITASVSGASAGNYIVTDTGSIYTITPAPLTITVNSVSDGYGNLLPTFTSTLGGLTNGDTSTDGKHIVHPLAVKRRAVAAELGGVAGDLTVNYSTSASSTAPYSNVGTYPINATLAGAAAGDYTVTTVTPGTLTITAVPLAIAENSTNGVYGSAPPAFSGSLATLVNGDTLGGTITVTYTSTASSSSPFSDAGSYPISAVVTGSSAGNYTVTDTGSIYTITPASLTITVASVSDGYGNPLPTFTSTLGGLTNGDTSTDGKHIVHPLAVKRHGNAAEFGGVAGDLTVNYSTSANSASPYSNVGTYPINATLAGAASGDYTVTGTTPGTLTITPATLTITENSASGVYGSASPAFSGSLATLVNGDTLGGTINVTYSSTASSGSPFSDVGGYPITASVTGASASNYTVTDTGSIYTITPAPLTIAVNSVSETWNNPLPTFTSQLTGLVNGDSSSDAKHIVHPLTVKRHANATAQFGGSADDLLIDYTTNANSSLPYSDAGTYWINASLDSSGAYADYQVTSVTQGVLTIDQAAQSITFPLLAGTSLQYANTTVLLDAVASSGLPTTYYTFTPSVCSLSQSGNVWTLNLLTVGSCSMGANQAGNIDYQEALASGQTFFVHSASQTITWTPIPDQTAVTTIGISASASSGLSVSYASLTPSICTTSTDGNGNPTAVLLVYGACTLQASQAGNTTFAAAPAASITFAVHHASQTITWADPVAQTANTPLALAATATSGQTVSFISFSPSICTISTDGNGNPIALMLASGSCSLQANQAGNAIYAAAPPVGWTFFVHTASQAITFSPIPAQNPNTSTGLTATATSGLTVTFTSVTPANCSVSGSTVSSLAYGTCTIDADQAGNGVFSAAPTVAQSFKINSLSQTISWGDPVSQTANTPLALVATATSGLPVSFVSFSPSICTISTDGNGNPIALMLATGNCALAAEQTGNNIYTPAPNVGWTFFVHHAGQTITFPAVGTQTAGNSVLLPATASSGLAVSYASTTPGVCTINVTGLYAVLAGPGTCTIQASQAGNAAYGAAATVTQSFTVVAPPAS